jgi:pimeloyl-ACP methyl ester carboxylesterase
MKALYFHGGPGFNSNPERNLLRERFIRDGWDVRFWDEPSVRRPAGPAYCEKDAFENLLLSAEAFLLEYYDGTPVLIIGHSFGAHALCFLALHHPEKIAKAVFISSDLSVTEADRGLFRILAHDYLSHGDDRGEKLEALLARNMEEFSPATEEGYDLLIQNPRLLDYYWFNRDQMAEFLPYYAEPGYEIDLEGFRSVRRSFREVHLVGSMVPATAVFGENDVCISEDAEVSKLKSRFLDLTIHRLPHSAHYPHVEETDRFLEILAAEVPRILSPTPRKDHAEPLEEVKPLS